jgi:hypothetical protein
MFLLFLREQMVSMTICLACTRLRCSVAFFLPALLGAAFIHHFRRNMMIGPGSLIFQVC